MEAAPRPIAAPRTARPPAPRAVDRRCFAALDLGTNNCRLLIARANGEEIVVVDAFSRIVRLGEGLGASGRLSDRAMDRAVAALAICADKLRRRPVTGGAAVTVPFTATVPVLSRRPQPPGPSQRDHRARRVLGIASPALSRAGDLIAFRALGAL